VGKCRCTDITAVLRVVGLSSFGEHLAPRPGICAVLRPTYQPRATARAALQFQCFLGVLSDIAVRACGGGVSR